MPKNLKNAYVAIEDERFYKHSGVDFKRTGAAFVQYVLHWLVQFFLKIECTILIL